MDDNTRLGISRRESLRGLAVAACSASLPGTLLSATGDEPVATHNWMLVGSQTAFLSHLPMFEGLNAAGTEYATPHRFQVILQASFGGPGKPLEPIYFEERRKNPKIGMFAVKPARQFVLAEVVGASPPRSFQGTVVRGHLERGGTNIPALLNVPINIQKVIHFHKFDPAAQAPKSLDYYLFGRGTELFVVHSIVKPPDFDQILSVSVTGLKLTDDELAKAPRISIPSKKNSPSTRLKAGEEASAVTADGRKLSLRAIREFYFEEGELAMPATFDPTSLERSSGFSE